VTWKSFLILVQGVIEFAFLTAQPQWGMPQDDPATRNIYFLLPIFVLGFDSLMKSQGGHASLLAKMTESMTTISSTHQPIPFSTETLSKIEFETELVLQFFLNYLQTLTRYLSAKSSPEAMASSLISVIQLIRCFFFPLCEVVSSHESFHLHILETLQLLSGCIFLAPSLVPSTYLSLLPETHLHELSSYFDQVLSIMISFSQKLQTESHICAWISSLYDVLKYVLSPLPLPLLPSLFLLSSLISSSFPTQILDLLAWDPDK
jgi:hypothetical protein